MTKNSCSTQNFPETEWETNKEFEKDGWKMEALEEAYKYLVESTFITGLVIIHKGKMIFEYGNIKENSYVASCRKSITAMLYGPHIKSGKIKLDKTLRELGIDDVGGLLDIEKQAVIKDLISARSGVFHKGSNSGDFLQFAPERGSVKTGSYWLYNNWDFNVAQYILEQESGCSIYEEIEKTLAIPLQMQDWDINIQRSSGDETLSKYPARHMVFSTRDTARIGLLMLNKGKWNNTQIIEEDWVDEMVSTKTTYNEINKNVPVFRDSEFDYGYGYMWWLWANTNHPDLKNAYSAFGAYGQSITVLPNIDVVIAYKTNSLYGRRTPTFNGRRLLQLLVESYQKS